MDFVPHAEGADTRTFSLALPLLSFYIVAMFRRFALILIFCSLASGCAIWRRHGIVLHPAQKIRIAVLPVENEVKIKKLKSIQSVPKNFPKPANEKELITEQMLSVTKNLTLGLDKRVADSYFFEAVPPEEVEAALKGVERFPNRPLSAEQIKMLGEKLRAPLVLTTRLSGYGKLKTEWLVYLLASGLAEGAIDGVIVAVGTSSTAAAVAIATEELVQEGLTWGGGGFLFNKFFTPVILETRLYSGVDGRRIWNKVALARINGKRLKEFPKEKRKELALRLQLTSERAIETVVKGLENQAWRNLSEIER